MGDVLIGERIKQLRTRMDMSQEKLAEYAGVSAACISLIEKGLRRPRINTLERIAEATGTKLKITLE